MIESVESLADSLDESGGTAAWETTPARPARLEPMAGTAVGGRGPGASAALVSPGKGPSEDAIEVRGGPGRLGLPPACSMR